MQLRATVFIVDDDEAVRDSLGLLLETHGFAVELFDSVAAFSRSYRPSPPACLVLDHDLPVRTGLDFLESRGGPGPELPVILMSGGGGPTLEARARAAGVAYYFDKPLDAERFLDAVFRLVGSPPISGDRAN